MFMQFFKFHSLCLVDGRHIGAYKRFEQIESRCISKNLIVSNFPITLTAPIWHVKCWLLIVCNPCLQLVYFRSHITS